METLPARSSGVLVAPVGDGALAYDLMTETAAPTQRHSGPVVEPLRWAVRTQRASSPTGRRSQASLEDQCQGGCRASAPDTFAELALVGRAEVFVAPDATPTTTSGAATPDAADLSTRPPRTPPT
ncbi:MAG: hypothetical protein V9F03_05600 [Microthrixaceae bacterium]